MSWNTCFSRSSTAQTIRLNCIYACLHLHCLLNDDFIIRDCISLWEYVNRMLRYLKDSLWLRVFELKFESSQRILIDITWLLRMTNRKIVKSETTSLNSDIIKRQIRRWLSIIYIIIWSFLLDSIRLNSFHCIQSLWRV